MKTKTMSEAPKRGRLFVLSGPSGVGKGTLRRELFRRKKDLYFSISCTTRKPRPGETDGVDYRFVSKDDFIKRKDSGEFLEWAEVHGNYYGTLWADVDRVLSSGGDVVLEIDVKGAFQVMDRCKDVISVFIAPPSIEELRKRLLDRGSDDEKCVELRLKNAKSEMEERDKYDFIVTNGDLDDAAKDLEDIVRRFSSVHSEEV